MRKKSWIYIPIACIIFTGFALRIWPAISQPVFGEEAFSIVEAKTVSYPFDPSYPPVFPFLLKAWTFLSINLIWVRLVSVIAGTISIWVIWKIGKEIADIRVANLSAFILSISSLHIHYSWIARPHSIALLFGLLSFYVLFRIQNIIKNGNRLPFVLPLLLFLYNLLACLTTYSFAIFVSAEIITILIWITQQSKWKNVLRQYMVLIVFITLHLTIPLLQGFILIGNITRLQAISTWIPSPDTSVIASTFSTLLNASGKLFGEFEIPSRYLPVTFANIILVITILYLSVKKYSSFASLLLLISTAFSIGCAFVAYRFFAMPIMQVRLLLPLHAILLLGVACAISILLFKKNGTTVRVCGVILVTLYLYGNFLSWTSLNGKPFYNDAQFIHTLYSLRTTPDVKFFVLPHEDVTTVQYIWQLKYNNQLGDKPDGVLLSEYLQSSPANKRVYVAYFPGILSPEEQNDLSSVSKRCTKQEFINEAAIYDCSRLAY